MQKMSIESEGEGGGGEDIEITVEEYLTTKERQTKRRAWGIVLLLIVVAIWTGSTYLVQFIYSNNFEAPYFLTFVCNSMFVIYLPLHFWSRRHKGERKDYARLQQQQQHDTEEEEEETSFYHRASTHVCLRAALIVSPLWFLANGSYNYSLSSTSPSSNTIIAPCRVCSRSR